MTAYGPADATERDTFLAMLVHETRTSLNNVSVFLHLLEETPLTPGQREHLAAVRRGTGTMTALSDDLVDFVRTGRPEFTVESVPVDLRARLAECAAPFRLLAARKGLFLRVEEDPAIPASSPGDPIRLYQVLTNLLSNAVKFTETGGVTVRLERDEAGGCILFEVHDSGPGMEPETLARLFEPFFQAPGTASRFGGSGLGLAISHRLTKLMGGTLEVASTPGMGTLFRLSLPQGRR